MNASLNDLALGEQGTIADITAPRALARRLLEMGLTAGTRLQVIRQAPLGDPIEIRIRGYHLTLRRAEACTVLLEA
ncbi:MAG: ferrous iron transport protein A [Planctomycetes bacterium]|nr:ferrous iron transport protein A [Planctomycetota bacterium]